MNLLIIDRIITNTEWGDINDNLWDNPQLFFTQKEFKFVEKEIKIPLENFNLVSFEGQNYVVHKSHDEKGNQQGLILLNFQSSFFINSDKNNFCSGCSSNQLHAPGEVPFGELSTKQLSLIDDREKTTYCGNCQEIKTFRKRSNSTIVVSKSRKRRI